MILLPQPKAISKMDGVFSLSGNTPIELDAGCCGPELEWILQLKEDIRKTAGCKAYITKSFQSSCIYGIRFKKTGGSPQSYRLSIDTDGIEVDGADSEGLFYGIQTLRQIVRQYSPDLPCVRIKDCPSFENRGFFHDVTRGKVPTFDTLTDLADRLSFYKINQLQLYVEHSFAFKNQTEIWTGNDPLTAEEIILLDEYCRKRCIELVPSLATFGHLYHALVSDTYRELCELEWENNIPFSWIDRMMHHTLDVSNPKSIEFVKDMLDEYIPLFTSGKFNICCDETFDLGKGKSRELAEKFGTTRLYVDFLKQIITHVKKYRKQVMMWGDIILQHPEYISELTEDIICLNWNYEANAAEEDTRALNKAGVRQYVCPGVSQWSTLAGNLDDAFQNISRMIGHGYKYSAEGVLNTDWGDFGHINFLSASMTGMIFGAALSWNSTGYSTENPDTELDCSISVMEFGDKSGRLVGLLRELGRSSIIDWECIVGWLEQKHRGAFERHWTTDNLVNSTAESIVTGYKKALDLEKEIIKLSLEAPENRKTDYDELIISARGTALFQALGLIVKKYDYKMETAECIVLPASLAEQLEYWYNDYSALWRIRNKESELYRLREAFEQICRILRRY